MLEQLTLWDMALAFALGLIVAGLIAGRLHRSFRRRQHFDLTAISRRSFDNGWLSAGGDPARCHPETLAQPHIRAIYADQLPLDLPDHAADLADASLEGTLPWPPPGVSRNRAGRNRAGEAC